MKRLLTCAAVLSLGCVLARTGQPTATPIWVRSHNGSAVDVYLLCGDQDAEWLGTVGARRTEAFEIPTPRRYCARGLNFFLVVRQSGWGYWVGPFRPRSGTRVDLVIDKYAGLSSVQLIQELP